MDKTASVSVENSTTGIMAGLWPWHLANVNHALKGHCARRLMNHSPPSLIIRDRRGKGKKRKRRKGRRMPSVMRYSTKHKVYYHKDYLHYQRTQERLSSDKLNK